MAAPVISISSNISVESVGSSFPVFELDTYSLSEADPSESSLPPVSVAPMRSIVVSRSSSPTISTPEIAIASIPPAPSAVVVPFTDIISPVDTPPGIRRRRAILIRLGEDIPIGRLYRTHPGGPCHSSLDHSSSRHFISGHSLSRHTPPDTTITDSSTPPRFVYPPLTRTP
ncbi:hypothetical protein Tco_1317549 [Tanacetum coccineum]